MRVVSALVRISMGNTAAAVDLLEALASSGQDPVVERLDLLLASPYREGLHQLDASSKCVEDANRREYLSQADANLIKALEYCAGVKDARERRAAEARIWFNLAAVAYLRGERPLAGDRLRKSEAWAHQRVYALELQRMRVQVRSAREDATMWRVGQPIGVPFLHAASAALLFPLNAPIWWKELRQYRASTAQDRSVLKTPAARASLTMLRPDERSESWEPRGERFGRLDRRIEDAREFVEANQHLGACVSAA